jgi:hypothetical protein
MPDSDRDGFGAAVGVQPGQNLADVKLRGVLGNFELCCDRSIRQAFRTPGRQTTPEAGP